MSTALKKPVVRVTSHTYGEKVGLTGRAFGKQRQLVVTLHPGDLLALRPQGMGSARTVWFNLGELYVRGVKRDAMLKALAKKDRKATKGKS